MTVAELIEELKDHPADMRVVVRGYEGGYDEVYPSTQKVVIDHNWDGKRKPDLYFGRHGDTCGDEGEAVLVL